MKVLIVITSHDELGDTGKKTGFWLEELAAPYYVFMDGGAEITLASPKGGRPPLDPKSADPQFQTDTTRRFEADEEAKQQLATTVPLDTVRQEDFDTIFYPGGHGPMWDMPDNKVSIALLESFLQAGKTIGLVCHAPAALLHVRLPNGKLLVKDRRLTAWTDSEEAAVELTDVVPFLLETELRKLGAQFERTDDWGVHVTSDGPLVTGQNPASSGPAAMLLMQAISAQAAAKA